MRYLSVCSGIEAATVAWKPLGWECAGVSEIDKFPRAVLQERLGAVPVDADHRWEKGQNFIPLFGDFTEIEAHHVGPIDLLVGGTPCQSFSIAGKRLGLDDPRGNLTIEFFRLAARLRPRWIVWENVPGILSHDGRRTFGAVLATMEECGFRWAYRTIDAQFARVGRFGRAVPQRRRRVFLVGYSGTAPIHPRAVLFDRESLRGNPAPRREAGERFTTDVAPSLVSSGRGVERAGETRGQDPVVAARMVAFGEYEDDGTAFDCDGGLITSAFNKQALGLYSEEPVASTCSARDYKDATDLVAHALRGEGFDASEDGTGRGTPIVPVQQPFSIMPMNSGKDYKARETDVAQPIMAGGPVGGNQGGDFVAFTLTKQSPTGGGQPQAVAFAQNTRDEVRLFGGDGQTVGALSAEPGMKQTSYVAFTAKDHGGDAVENISPTFRAGGHTGSHANAGVMPAVAFTFNTTQLTSPQNGQDLGPDKPCHSLAAKDHPPAAATAWGVRRLTPTECARLQGFPDDWARIPWRGKPAEECPDGPQYKAYGNSMAVNVMCWIGERIQAISEYDL